MVLLMAAASSCEALLQEYSHAPSCEGSWASAPGRWSAYSCTAAEPCNLRQQAVPVSCIKFCHETPPNGFAMLSGISGVC